MSSSIRFSKNRFIVFSIFLLSYFSWLALIVGLRTDHIYILVAITVLFYLTDTTHRIVCGLFCFLAWVAIYDSLRALPGYSFFPVHVQDLYELEKSIFGINYNGSRITPNEFFTQNLNTVSDFFSGLFYLMWMPLPIAISIYLALRDPKILMEYSLCFLMCNILGLIGYYGCPAAPPWYVADHGFELILDAPGSASHLMRFDSLIGFPIFEGIYGKSANVFGAIPSLHSAYPVITLFYMKKHRFHKLTVLAFVYMIGTWYGAIYGNQHYIIDVILGVFCAIFAIVLCEKFIYKSGFKNFMNRLALYIS